MAAGFLVGYKRKRAVLIALCAASLLTLGVGVLAMLGETALPLKTQLDELRLLDPNFAIEKSEKGSSIAMLAPELDLADYAVCRSQAENTCSKIIGKMLESRPADGRLWLEYSRSLTLENGLDAAALSALQHSYEFAPYETWMREARSGFALSVWPGLSQELQAKASDEITRGISTTQFANFIASFYVDRLLSRKFIGTILETAPAEDQRRVLGLISAKTKS
jgi:hypothetical protein